MTDTKDALYGVENGLLELVQALKAEPIAPSVDDLARATYAIGNQLENASAAQSYTLRAICYGFALVAATLANSYDDPARIEPEAKRLGAFLT